MAKVTEVLALVIQADSKQAVTALGNVGSAAERNLKTLEGSSERMSASMVKLGSASAVGGAAVLTALYGATKAAAQLGDVTQATSVIFGKDLTSTIDQFAANARTKLGLSKAAAKDALLGFSTFGKTAGLEGRKLFEFSAGLEQIGVDIASLRGLSNEEVFASLTSGLAGETESLRRIGIALTDAQKRAEAVRLGLRSAQDNAPLTAREQVLTTASLIQSSPLAQSANGDFARTFDSLPNQLKVVDAEFQNLKTEIGQGALPVFQQLLGVARGVTGAFNALPDGIQGALGSIAALAALTATVGGGLSIAGGGIIDMVGKTKALRAAVDEAGGGLTGLKSVLGGGLNPAVLGVTAAVGVGLGVYEAWAKNTAQVESETKTLIGTLTTITDKAQVLPTLAAQFNQILDTRKGGQDAFAATGLAVTDVVNAVNKAPGALDKFRNEVDGAFGSLENLDGISGSIFNVGGGIDGLKASAEKASPAVKAMLLNLIGLYEANKIDAGQLRAVIDYMTDLDKEARGSAEGVRFQAEQLAKVAPQAKTAADAMALYTTATDTTAGVDAQAEALSKLKALFPEAAQAAGLTAGAVAGLNTGLAAGAASAQQGASALEQWANAAKAAADAANTAANGAASFQDQFRAAAQAQVALFQPALDVESASIRVAQAQKRLDDITDPAKRQERIADALDQVTSASDGLTDALKRRRKAQEDLDRIMKKSAVSGSVPLLQQIAKVADDSLKDAENALADAKARFGEGSAQAIAAQQRLDSAKGRKSTSIDLLNQALSESAKNNASAQKDAADELRKANNDVSRAQRNKDKAERAYSETLQASADNSIEARQATLDLTTAEAQLYVAQAAYTGAVKDGIDPTQQLAVFLAGVAQSGALTNTQMGALNGWMDSLRTTLEQTNPLVQNLVNILNGVPGTTTGGTTQGTAQREGIPAYQTRPSGVIPDIPAGVSPGSIIGSPGAMPTSPFGFKSNSTAGQMPSLSSAGVTGGTVGGSKTVKVSQTNIIKATEPKRTAAEVAAKLRAAAYALATVA